MVHSMQDLSEFQSGADYDCQYDQNYEPDIRLLLSHIKATRASSMLDVCCGTGIVTIPLAQSLVHTVGVDIAEPMLQQARIKSRGVPGLEFILADAASYQLNQTFDLAIMTGNAWQAFASDDMLRRVLNNIACHLNAGGHFIFDTRLPVPNNLAVQPDFELWQTYTNPAGQAVKYFGRKARFDSQQSIMYFEKYRLYPDGQKVASSVDLKYRSVSAITQSLSDAGFDVVHSYQNWRAEPLDDASSNLVCVARLV